MRHPPRVRSSCFSTTTISTPHAMSAAPSKIASSTSGATEEALRDPPTPNLLEGGRQMILLRSRGGTPCEVVGDQGETDRGRRRPGTAWSALIALPRRLATAPMTGRGFGTARLLQAGMAERAGHANTNALLFSFDDVSPYRLLRFVALGRQVCPGF